MLHAHTRKANHSMDPIPDIEGSSMNSFTVTDPRVAKQLHLR